MKPPFAPAVLHKIAESADRIAALAPDVAAIIRRLAEDPALSPLSASNEIDWLTDDHSTTVAQLQAECHLMIEQLTSMAKSARKTQRKERVASIFKRK
jgi:hypothetical protein